MSDNDHRDEDQPDSEVTRREWLLRIGEGGTLLALAGADFARAQTGADATSLPPGVWLPSYDHISHALANRQPFVAIPQGCEVEYRQPPPHPFQPRFFAAGDFQTVSRLIGLILGEPTESPVVAEIAEWIDLRVLEAPAVRTTARALAPEYRTVELHYHGAEEIEELENSDPQAVCRDGLAWLAEESTRRFAKAFVDLDEADQLAILTAKLGDANERNARISTSAASTDPGALFLRWLKAMTIDGFYTSRAGLDELDYKGNSFYTSPPGCDTFGPR